MISILFWVNVARADHFDMILRERVALLQLVHRCEDPSDLKMDDVDRWQALELLRETNYRGAVFNLLLKPGLISVGTTGRTSLRRKLRQDGYDGDGTVMRRQLLLEIAGEAMRDRVNTGELVHAISGYILKPSPMVRLLQTHAAARTQADLVGLVGQVPTPEAMPIVLEYLRGLTATWPDLSQVSHYQIAAEALRTLSPQLAPSLLAEITGIKPPTPTPELPPVIDPTKPPEDVAPATVGETPPEPSTMRERCQAYLGTFSAFTSIRSWRSTWLRRP